MARFQLPDFLFKTAKDNFKYDDLIELRSGKKEIVAIHSGILEFFNMNDTWLKIFIDGVETQSLNPGSKDIRFMLPIKKGSIIKIFGPGKDYSINAKICYKDDSKVEEKRIVLPDDTDTWIDFFMELSTKVLSFKVETDYGFILIFSEDTIKPGTTRLSYFHTSMDTNKCYHCQFSKQTLIDSLPLSNIKEVTAIYK